MSPSRSWVLALTLLPALAPAPAWSAERTMFETVKGWEVERTVGDTSADPCLMSYSYVDKDDDDADNTVTFALDGANAVLVLGYEHWAWDKDEKVRAPFVIGKKVVNAKSTWIGDGQIMKAVFPDTIVPHLLAAKTIEVRIKDAEAEFDIPGFAPAYEALRRCNAAPRPGNAAGDTVAESPKPGPDRRAAEPAAPAALPLAIAKLQFVTRPADRFGDIAARGSNAFPAGEKMRTYLEVTGQTIRPAAAGQRSFGLSLDYEVLDGGGRVLAGQKRIIDQDFTLDAQAPQSPGVYFDVGVSLTGLEPGAYILAYTLHDKLDGRTATGSLPFASVPAPAESSQARLKAYFVGLMFQRTVKDCDFATTARQRSALDAKVAILDPQPAALAEQLRTQAAAGGPNCPDTPELEAKFRTNLGNFLELSPEAYVERMDQRIAEREAQAAPKQTAPGQTAPADDAALCKAKDAAPAGQVEACSRALDAKTPADPERITLLLARADALFGTRNFDRAITDYDAILAKVPDHLDALRYRGLMYYLKRDFDKALADENAALRIEPKDALTLLGRGNTYEEMGRTDEALADYDQSILIAPGAGAYASRARIRTAKGETERAIADLDEAIRLEPSESEFRDARAKLVAKQGQGQGTANGDRKL